MSILEIEADRLDLDQGLENPIELRGEIAICAANRILGGNLGILIVTENLREHVGNDHNGVRLSVVA